MKGAAWVKLGLFLAIVAGIGLALHGVGVDFSRLSLDRLRAFVLSFGAWAPFLYILVYAQPLVPLPASLMTGFAGAAFGKGWGLLAALTGSMLRASTEFLVARWLGRDAVANLLKGKVAALDQTLGDNGFKAVLLIRLIPSFPFDLQNYALGFSRVKFLPYIVASFLGIMPGCLAFVFLGESLTNPHQLWKLLAAILLIVGLMGASSVWKHRHRVSVGNRA